MENQIIYSSVFDEASQIKEVLISQEILKLSFENRNDITISSEHDQDCCEHVYADFTVVENYHGRLINKKVNEIIIKRVEDMGFLICLRHSYDEWEKIFVPCYDYQNGYYSSNLKIIINNDGSRTEVDISNCVEHHY